MLRYMMLVGALCAGCAPFLSGGVPRPDVDVTVIGLAVGVVGAAALALGSQRSMRVFAGLLGTGLAAVVWWLLVSDLLTGLTGDDLPVLAVGSLAVAAGAISLAEWRTHPAEDTAERRTLPDDGEAGQQAQPAESATEQAQQTADAADRPARPNGWRVRPVGVVAAVVVVVAAVFAPVVAGAVIVRSKTLDSRGFTPEAVVERPGGRQWSWQPAAEVVDVVPSGHGVAVAMHDGSLVALDGTDGWVAWRYARPGARVGAVVATLDRRAVVAAFGSSRNTKAMSVVVLDAETGAPRFELVVRSVLVEVGELMPGTQTLALRDDDVITGYDLVSGEVKWRWSPPAGCTSRFSGTARGRTTVLAPVECPTWLGVVALDEVTGQERWRHEIPLGPADGERQDVLVRATRDGSVMSLRVVATRAVPGSVVNGLLDAGTGRVLIRPDRPSTVRADLGVTPLLEEQEGARVTAVHAIDPATGVTTPLAVDVCPARAADTTTSTTYLRACEDNGRELTVVTQSLDGSPPTSTSVRLDGSGLLPEVRLVAAPGAIVVTRTASGGTPAPVVGLTG